MAEGDSERFELEGLAFHVSFSRGSVEVRGHAGDIQTFRGVYDFRKVPPPVDEFGNRLAFTGRIYLYGPQGQFYDMICWLDEAGKPITDGDDLSHGGVAKEDYRIRARPTATGPYTVDVAIESDLPDDSVLKVMLSLEGRQDDDLFVGTDFVRVPIENGQAHVTIDGAKQALPHASKLPNGRYELEVSFRSGWQENARIAEQAGIQERIVETVSVLLEGAGVPTTSSRTLSSGQRWIIANIEEEGIRWGAFWKRYFGPLRNVGHWPGYDSDTFDAYYFESVDMTLIINRRENKVVDWRFGLPQK